MGNSVNAKKSITLLERQTIALERIAEYLDRETTFSEYLKREKLINTPVTSSNKNRSNSVRSNSIRSYHSQNSNTTIKELEITNENEVTIRL